MREKEYNFLIIGFLDCLVDIEYDILIFLIIFILELRKEFFKIKVKFFCLNFNYLFLKFFLVREGLYII